MALIWPERNLIYIMPWRTGSSTIRKILTTALKDEPIEFIPRRVRKNEFLYDRPEGIIDVKHCRMAEVRHHFGGLYDKSFIVASVRNPFDWITSTWEIINNSKEGRWEDWDEFLMDYKNIPGLSSWTNHQGKLAVDHLIRLESIEEDLVEVFDYLGKPMPLIPHLHKGIYNKDKYWTPELKKLIYAHYKECFTTLNYK